MDNQQWPNTKKKKSSQIQLLKQQQAYDNTPIRVRIQSKTKQLSLISSFTHREKRNLSSFFILSIAIFFFLNQSQRKPITQSFSQTWSNYSVIWRSIERQMPYQRVVGCYYKLALKTAAMRTSMRPRHCRSIGWTCWSLGRTLGANPSHQFLTGKDPR